MTQESHDLDKELQGSWWPHNFLFAIVDDASDADRAAQSLREHGVNAADIHLLRGERPAEVLDTEAKHARAFQKLVRWLWTYTADSGQRFRDYEEAGREGKTVVVVHAESLERAGEIRDVLAEYGAHMLNYFGPEGTIQRL